MYHNANNIPSPFSTAIMPSAAEILRDYLQNKYKNIKIIGPERKSWLRIIPDQNLQSESAVYVNDSIIHPNNRGWYDLSRDDYNKLVSGPRHYYAIMLEKNPEHTFLIPGSALEAFFSQVEPNFKQGKLQWDFSIIERNGSHNTLVVNRAPGKEHSLAGFLNKWGQINNLKEKADQTNRELTDTEESTWIKNLIDTFIKLGGAAKYYHLSDIYKTFVETRRTKNEILPRDYENIIRYYLQVNSRGSGRDLFQPKEIGSGYWMLKGASSLESGSSISGDVLQCLQTFPDERDLDKIRETCKALDSFLRRFPYGKQPDLIDKLLLNDIYEKGNNDTFYHHLKSFEGFSQALLKWKITETNLEEFKELLRIAVDKNKSLSEKIDDPAWERISGFGGEKHVPKKIVHLYNYDISLGVYSNDHMELSSTKLGKDFREKSRSKYGKDYEILSEGQKYELHMELLLEARNEINNQFNQQWDNTTFWWSLYHCVLKSEPPYEEKDTLHLETFDDRPLSIPTYEEMENGYEKIRSSLLIPKEKVIEIVTALASGRHVLLAGPIGTGKTRLAQLIPELFWEKIGGYYAEYYTATADWNTQDVIGGIYPKMENERVAYDI